MAGQRPAASAPVEPSAVAVEWANKHRDVFTALLHAGYSRAEALQIMQVENWAKVHDPDGWS